jgi:hypothetical protein
LKPREPGSLNLVLGVLALLVFGDDMSGLVPVLKGLMAVVLWSLWIIAAL